jgi:hypothetical protein
MNILGSHIHRIRDLRFDVVFSSSLPSFLDGFHGSVPILHHLELKCREDDGGPDHSEPVALTECEDFQCPELRVLVIDGRNYYNACRRDPRWTDKLADISDLTISHFKPRPTESFTPYDLLLPLSASTEIGTICITDLVLHPSPEYIPPFDCHLTDPEFLRFEELHDFRVINEIVHLLNCPRDILLNRCTFGDPTDGFGHFEDSIRGEITLEKIANRDIALLLHFWSGPELRIMDCPGFNDIVLDMMSSNEGGGFICAKYVRDLWIHNCPNFSILALRRLVESRLDFPHNFDPDNPTPTKIDWIFLNGNVPSISQEDRAWFVDNVHRFTAYC